MESYATRARRTGGRKAGGAHRENRRKVLGTGHGFGKGDGFAREKGFT